MHCLVVIGFPEGVAKFLDKLDTQSITFFRSVQCDAGPTTIDFVGNVLKVFSVQAGSNYGTMG
jgi:hypothetical protein